MLIQIDSSYEHDWRHSTLTRYEFAADDRFIDCEEHGVHVSREPVPILDKQPLEDLPGWLIASSVEVHVVPSLVETASQWFDFRSNEFLTTLHVSMIRMGNLPGWAGNSKPVVPSGN